MQRRPKTVGCAIRDCFGLNVGCYEDFPSTNMAWLKALAQWLTKLNIDKTHLGHRARLVVSFIMSPP
jgi:hypothetical protein